MPWYLLLSVLSDVVVAVADVAGCFFAVWCCQKDIDPVYRFA